MNDLATPEVVTAATAVGSGLLGAAVGQRTVRPAATRWERVAHYMGSWACAPLFGPFLARKLGMADDLTAVCAVCGACSIFGMVLVDRMVRYLRTSAGFLDLVARVVEALRGAGK